MKVEGGQDVETNPDEIGMGMAVKNIFADPFFRTIFESRLARVSIFTDKEKTKMS